MKMLRQIALWFAALSMLAAPMAQAVTDQNAQQTAASALSRDQNHALLDRIRRAANKAALSNPRNAGLASSPPTITDNQGTVPAQATVYYSTDSTSRTIWHVVGGVYGTNNRMKSGILDASNTELATSYRFEVMADSRYFTVKVLPSTAPYRILVDGKYVSTTGFTLTNTIGLSAQYVLLDFGSRAVRRICIEPTRTGTVLGGYVEDGAKAWPVDTSNIIHAAFLGDSYIFGSGPNLTADGVAVQMGDWLGMAIHPSGAGGTGWKQGNTTVYRFDQRIANGDLALSYYPPEVIFLLTSVNDAYTGQDYAAVTANALTGLRAIRAQYPRVPIVVFGTIAAPNFTSSEISNAENAAAAAVTALNDPLCKFVPVNTDPAGAWVTGKGSELNFSAALSGATSATMIDIATGANRNWDRSTSSSIYTIVFSDGSTRLGNFTAGSSTVTWTGAVTASATAMVRQSEGNARYVMNTDWTHPSNYGAGYFGQRYAIAALAALESMLGS